MSDRFFLPVAGGGHDLPPMLVIGGLHFDAGADATTGTAVPHRDDPQMVLVLTITVVIGVKPGVAVAEQHVLRTIQAK